MPVIGTRVDAGADDTSALKKTRHAQSSSDRGSAVVCTKNLIRVDEVRESPKLTRWWGLKLGIEVTQWTVAKYMVKRRGPPSQRWRTFLRNHAPEIAARDLFLAPRGIRKSR
jgi:hypothetical protein